MRSCLDIWKEKVQRMNLLVRAGFPGTEHLRLVSYERFLADTQGTAEWLGGPSPRPACACRPPTELVHDHVHKVNCNDISQFVHNVAEVEALFSHMGNSSSPDLYSFALIVETEAHPRWCKASARLGFTLL
jgi:hypothetical protein